VERAGNQFDVIAALLVQNEEQIRWNIAKLKRVRDQCLNNLFIAADHHDLGIKTFALEKAFFFADENRRVTEGGADYADSDDVIGADRLRENAPNTKSSNAQFQAQTHDHWGICSCRICQDFRG